MYPNQYQYMGYLPQQQVVRVSGKASIDQMRMAPNSSVLVLDETAPLVWLCTSDGIGKITAQAYDITLHQEKPPVDLSILEQRIAAIETMLKGEQHESDATEPEQVRAKKRA